MHNQNLYKLPPCIPTNYHLVRIFSVYTIKHSEDISEMSSSTSLLYHSFQLFPLLYKYQKRKQGMKTGILPFMHSLLIAATLINSMYNHGWQSLTRWWWRATMNTGQKYCTNYSSTENLQLNFPCFGNKASNHIYPSRSSFNTATYHSSPVSLKYRNFDKKVQNINYAS